MRQVFDTEVDFLNPSVGGKSTDWGVENARELVSVQRPDLAILAFGMNDGTGRLSAEAFKNNIGTIMESVRSYNSDADLILVAPMLPNPLAAIPGQPDMSFLGEQENYREALEQLAGVGTVVADMTTIHRELLKHKLYCDMTGNNVNHPNDFLVRWYAQVVSALLVKE